MPLSPEQFRLADRLFHECLRQPPSRLTDYLDTHCPADPAVREFVRTLLEHDAAPRLADTHNINQGLRDQAHSVLNADESAGRIGAYKLLEKLGEGGFGAVYLVEQEVPVRRRTALKIIKLGMDTRQIVARFEAERQALAMMDHPSIAKVFDAGATPTGRPYFVMELVRGLPITQYCDAHRLSTRQRVELFIEVCRGVQHAHHKGVIHRDLKPSNILVTEQDGRPAAKIIDFGIAKAIAQPLTAAVLHTQQNQLIGTPAYMSPEQADTSGLDIDTRSDVYSLGVVLYELLTGTLPFDQRELASPSGDAIRKLIKESAPPRPSLRLATLNARGSEPEVALLSPVAAPGDEGTSAAESPGSQPRRARSAGRDSTTATLQGPATLAMQIAQWRNTDPPTLRRQLRGELDWITMKAMEKDRSRRYETPAGFAADLDRYLRREAVVAGPPSTLYRLRTFVRRHRGWLAATAVVALALVGGLVMATYGLLEARQERDRAALAAAKAQAVNRFLEELFGSIDPAMTKGRDLTVREVFGRAEQKISAAALRDQPEIEAAVRHTLGVTYRSLGWIPEAEQQFRVALSLRERTLGRDHLDTITTQLQLGALISTWRDAKEGGPMLQAAHDARVRIGRTDDAEYATMLTEMGRVVDDFGKRQELVQKAYELRLRLLGPDHPDVGHSLIELGYAAAGLGDLQKAIDLNKQGLAVHRKAYGDSHPHVAGDLYCVAELHMDANRPEEAIPYYREAAQVYDRAFGANSTSEARARNGHAVALLQLQRLAEAELQLRAALLAEATDKSNSADFFATVRGNLGGCLVSQGKLEEAEPLLLRSLEMSLGLPNSAEDVRLARERLRILYQRANRPEEAAKYAATQPISAK